MGSAFKGTKAEVVSEVSPISQNSRAHKKRTAKEETHHLPMSEVILGDCLIEMPILLAVSYFYWLKQKIGFWAYFKDNNATSTQ